jgi:hypothetical protein
MDFNPAGDRLFNRWVREMLMRAIRQTRLIGSRNLLHDPANRAKFVRILPCALSRRRVLIGRGAAARNLLADWSSCRPRQDRFCADRHSGPESVGGESPDRVEQPHIRTSVWTGRARSQEHRAGRKRIRLRRRPVPCGIRRSPDLEPRQRRERTRAISVDGPDLEAGDNCRASFGNRCRRSVNG